MIVQWAIDRWGNSFPYGTLFVNVAGSFLLGFLFILSLNRISLSPRVFAFLGAGFCGAFTTVSTFSVETLHLSQSGFLGVGITNIILNTGLSLLAAFLGMIVAKS
ncbi:MAG: fluoride efflux transporter CrcB [Nitrospirales bacterium]|nr:fluoride efflux transporter CrcB [Nitrospirales bacterium]